MNVLSYFKNITTFVFDIDGVLTDGTVLLLDNGLQARQMHIKDGLALQMALKGGYGCVRDVIEKVMKLNNKWYVDTEVSSR